MKPYRMAWPIQLVRIVANKKLSGNIHLPLIESCAT
jgi:hypothetical protein